MARSSRIARSLESAESNLRGGIGPNPTHDESTGQRFVRAGSEERKLREWALGYYNKPGTVKVPRETPLGRGAEHEVYFDGRRNRVVKITRRSQPASFGFGISLNNDGQGATAGEYLDRLLLQNKIFNDDVQLEGVLLLASGTRVVTSQPFIQGEAATAAQIDGYMRSKGFGHLSSSAYYRASSGVLVHDLYPRNVLLTTGGNVRAIDPAIMRATPLLAEFIRRRSSI